MPKSAKVRGGGCIAALEKKPRSKCRKWQLRIYLGVDSNGKQIMKTRRVAGSYREAQALLREFAEEVESQRPRSGLTLEQYLNVWHADREASGDYSERTLTCDRDKMRNVVRLLGAKPIESLTSRDISRAYAAMRAGNSTSGRKLSGTTVLNIHKTLSCALRDAAKDGLLDRDMVENIPRPKNDTRERRALNDDDARRLLTALDPGDWAECALILCLSCGLRRSEALGLTVEDVGDGFISIRRSLNEDGTPKPPKSKAGRRTMPIPEFASRALTVRMEEHAIEIGRKLRPDDPIMTDSERFQKPNKLTSWWKRNRSTFGLDCTIHELRHTFVTMLARANVHPSVAQKLVGDSTISVVLDVYTHIQDDEKETAMEAFENHLW